MTRQSSDRGERTRGAQTRGVHMRHRGDGVMVRVPAKINLHLAVGDLRPDGFHELMTVFHAVGLWDTVTVRKAAELSVRVTGEGADVLPQDSRNLAWRAAAELAEQNGINPGVSIVIDKAIPVAAGLAGGSADAAATLLGCDALWGLRSSRTDLDALAAQLGSDVPFGMLGGTAIGTGRGELLSPVLGARTMLWWVLALADTGLSTPAVYSEFDRRRAAGTEPGRGGTGPADRQAPANLQAPADLLRALQFDDLHAVADGLRNDLQASAIALAPALQQTLDAGVMLGALAGIVCGSGPTCAFLVHTADSARVVAERMTRERVCRTTRVAGGPVDGAQLW